MRLNETDVAILTPAFEAAQFIEDALKSVALQSGVRVQHVVQDGASRDSTADITARFPWIDVRSEPDLGQSDALNKALQRVSSRWVGWLNADEFYLPGALESLIAMGERSGADVVFGDTAFVDQNGRFVRLVPQHGFSRFVLRSYGPFIDTASTVFRRSALPKSPWDRSLRLIMDWDLLLSLERSGATFIHVPRPAGAFRLHQDQATFRLAEQLSPEYEVLRRRHGVPPSRATRRVGSVTHAAMKLASGAYFRQATSARFRGTDLRWFDSADALKTCLELCALPRGRPNRKPFGPRRLGSRRSDNTALETREDLQ